MCTLVRRTNMAAIPRLAQYTTRPWRAHSPSWLRRRTSRYADWRRQRIGAVCPTLLLRWPVVIIPQPPFAFERDAHRRQSVLLTFRWKLQGLIAWSCHAQPCVLVLHRRTPELRSIVAEPAASTFTTAATTVGATREYIRQLERRLLARQPGRRSRAAQCPPRTRGDRPGALQTGATPRPPGTSATSYTLCHASTFRLAVAQVQPHVLAYLDDSQPAVLGCVPLAWQVWGAIHVGGSSHVSLTNFTRFRLNSE